MLEIIVVCWGHLCTICVLNVFLDVGDNCGVLGAFVYYLCS